MGEEIVKSTVAYDHYERQVYVMRTGIGTYKKAKVVGRKCCIMAEILMSLTELGQLGGAKKVEEVTDDMVKNCMLDRGRCSSERTPEHFRDALSLVKVEPDVRDPQRDVLTFFADVATELRRSRAQKLKDEYPKALFELLIPKIGPAILQDVMK